MPTMFYDPMQYRIHLSLLADADQHIDTVGILMHFLEYLSQKLIHQLTVMSKVTEPVNVRSTGVIWREMAMKAEAIQKLLQIVEKNASKDSYYAVIDIGRKIPAQYSISCKRKINIIRTIKRFYDQAESEPNLGILVSEFMNCPTPDLSGIVRPFSWSVPSEFAIDFRWMQDGGFLPFGNCVSFGKRAYSVLIHLPRRYGVIGDFIEQFSSSLDQMSSLFYPFTASVTLDIASRRTHELVYRNRIGEDNYFDRIPGVCWGMWLTKEHKQALYKSGFDRKNAAFYAIKELPAGGLYLQISKSVDWLTSEQNKYAYQCLLPLLKPTNIPYPLLNPESLRDYIDQLSIIFDGKAILFK